MILNCFRATITFAQREYDALVKLMETDKREFINQIKLLIMNKKKLTTKQAKLISKLEDIFIISMQLS